MGDNQNDRSDNHNGGINGWGRQEHQGAWGRLVNNNGGWGQQIAEDNAAAREVRHVVSELLGVLAAVSSPGLIHHISEFVGNRLIEGTGPQNEEVNRHMGWHTV